MLLVEEALVFAWLQCLFATGLWKKLTSSQPQNFLQRKAVNKSH